MVLRFCVGPSSANHYYPLISLSLLLLSLLCIIIKRGQKVSLVYFKSPLLLLLLLLLKVFFFLGIYGCLNEGEEWKEEARMGRTPCCNKEGLRKGAWTADEDKILVAYITKNGHDNWRSLPKLAGLLRCGKSCRLRWTNYLRPGIKRGQFSSEEVDTIIQLHTVLGNKWSAIASHLPGRTDNDIKNFWNSHLRKQGSVPNHQNHQMSHPHGNIDEKVETPSTNHIVQWESVSVAPSFLDLPPASKTDHDPFLRLLNSEVGEAFCSFKKPCGVPCQSPVSSSSKFESSSGITLLSEPTSKLLSSADTVEAVPMNCKMEEEEEDTKSYELVDPSETTLKLLLDFPPIVNDMGFFQVPGENLSIYLQN